MMFERGVHSNWAKKWRNLPPPKKSEENLLTFTLPERCMLVTRAVHLSANEQDGNFGFL